MTEKKKDPKRVAAGKKAAAARRRTQGGGGGRSRRPKRPSLTVMLGVAGGLTLVSSTAGVAATRFTQEVDRFANDVGLASKAGTVTGTTLLATAIGLKLAGTLFPSIGRKWRGFLAGYNLRP